MQETIEFVADIIQQLRNLEQILFHNGYVGMCERVIQDEKTRQIKIITYSQSNGY